MSVVALCSSVVLREAGSSPTVVGVERQGLVRIREKYEVRVPWYRYSANWQPDPSAPAEGFYSETGPGWNDVEDAVAWGRRRAPIVYVRLSDGWRDWYNAGELDDRARPPTKRWEGSPRRRAANREPDYGGVVYIGEEFPDFNPTRRFEAVWTSADEVALGHEGDFADVDAAIDWGRARARIVLVAESPSGWGSFPTYEIRSAGEEDPPGERVPRIRARDDDGELIWEFRTRVSAPPLSAAEYAPRIQAALLKMPAVLAASCAPAERPARARSSPELAGIPDAEVEELNRDARPGVDSWVDVVVRVSSAARSQAHATAWHAVTRAHFATSGATALAAHTQITAVET